MALVKGLPRGWKGAQAVQTTKRWDDGYAEPFADGRNFYIGHNADGAALGYIDDRHMFMCAGSRAGKGTTAIIPALLTYWGSALVIDPKNENADITAAYRAEVIGQKVCLLDPFDKADPALRKYQAVFNPLTILHPGSRTRIEDAGLIADALVIQSGGDAHWDESAKNYIEGLLLLVATHKAYEGRRHLITVRELLGEQHDKRLRQEMGCDDEPAGVVPQAIRRAGLDFHEKQDREKESVRSTAKRHTKFLDAEAMARVLIDDGSRPTFELSELKTSPGGMTVYLCLPATRMDDFNRWLRLFVNMALLAMEEVPSKPDLPVVFVLDEFAVLKYLPKIEAAAGQVAGFGVKLWTIVQDIAQLRTIYRDRWESFIGNAGLLQFFGNTDVGTCEYISKLLGETTIETVSENESASESDGRKSQSASRQSSLHRMPLLLPDEVAFWFARDRDNQIVYIPGEMPLMTYRVPYYQEKGRLAHRAYYHRRG